MNKKQFIGIAILAIVIISGIAYKYLSPAEVFKSVTPPPPITVNMYISGEKVRFLADPKVVKRFADFGITVNPTTIGSINMVTTASTAGMDILWPTNQVASEIYRKRNPVLAEENTFNTPVVHYTYDVVCDALMKNGMVQKKADAYFITDYEKFSKMLVDGKQWKDIGLPQLNGKMKVFSTNPTKSNSGNMFAGLMANMVNGGEVVELDNLPKVLPHLVGYFGKMGFMDGTIDALFKGFLEQGVGPKPIIVGYETQLVEFALEHQDYAPLLKSKIRTLYPVPTMWSNNPALALTPKGKRFIEAMKDPEILKIAWENHGFRSGMVGVQNDPKILSVTGIPESIDSVISMPSADVMLNIIAALQNQPTTK